MKQDKAMVPCGHHGGSHRPAVRAGETKGRSFEEKLQLFRKFCAISLVASFAGGWLRIWRLKTGEAYGDNEFAGVNSGSTAIFQPFCPSTDGNGQSGYPPVFHPVSHCVRLC